MYSKNFPLKKTIW